MTSSRHKPHQTEAYLSLPSSTRAHHNRAVEWCQEHQCNALTPERTRSLGVTLLALDRLLTAGLWEVAELPATQRDDQGRIQFVHHIIDPRIGEHHVDRD